MSGRVSWQFAGKPGICFQSPRERPVGFSFPSPREIWKVVFFPSENAQEGRLTVRNLCLPARKGWALGENPVTPVNSASSAERASGATHPSLRPGCLLSEQRGRQSLSPTPRGQGRPARAFWSSGLSGSVHHRAGGLDFDRSVRMLPDKGLPVSSLLGSDEQAVGVTVQPGRLTWQSWAE